MLAGPCVIEGEEMALNIAEHVKKVTDRLGIPYVFKGSFKKANRSRLDSFTGIGDEKALKILAKVRAEFGIPVVTDIHTERDAEMAAAYVDVLQIPAFLCRQTDLLVAAAKTGKIVNIKKGQFRAGNDVRVSRSDRGLPWYQYHAAGLPMSGGCGCDTFFATTESSFRGNRGTACINRNNSQGWNCRGCRWYFY